MNTHKRKTARRRKKVNKTVNRRYAIKASYTFSGKVYVLATSRKEAIVIVKSGFGAVGLSLSSNDSDVVDWNFDMHPTKEQIK